jgi:hypothetical protein
MFLKTVLGLLLCSSIPAWATNAYATTGTEFGTTNLSTGAFTLLGSTELGSTPESLSAGLGEVGGLLYGAQAGTATLYEINETNGALTTIGTNVTTEYHDLGSTLTAMYTIDAAANLYSVNPSNGALTLIGSTGLAEPGTASLSTNSSTLYFTEFNGGAYQLYTINTSTGAATLVGTTSTPIGALMWDGASVLYGVQDSPDPVAVDTINTANGAVTLGPAVTGAAGDINGLAPIPSSSGVPEPASWCLLGAGLLVIGRWRRLQTR